MSVLDVVKPHRVEGLQRICTNTFSLVLLVFLSYLLPLLTVPSAFSHDLLLGPRASESIGFGRTVILSVLPLMRSFDAAYAWLCTMGESIERGDTYYIHCNAEALTVAIFIFNITQGIYAPLILSYDLTRKIKNTQIEICAILNLTKLAPLLATLLIAKSTTPQKPFTCSPTQSHSMSGPPLRPLDC
jgi:hypothetical protein